ncbi:MAG: hypothetical protein ACK4XY_08955 [Chloroherpetonaceae bacterium]
MTKQDLLEALRPYCHQDIRGVLIEIVLEEKQDLYDRLERIVSETLEANRTRLLTGYDWDVGESRWRNAFLVHLWSDDHDIYSLDDFDRLYNAEQIAELLSFLDTLKTALVEELADVQGWTLLP